MRLVLAVVAAALPVHGVFVPGQSLGGVRLGDRPAAVRAAWGRSFGVCTDCTRKTWYFNYKQFTQQGAAVEFRSGRVVAAYTLWRPNGWRTRSGLRLGDAEERIAALYGALPRDDCGGYAAYVEDRTTSVSAFYVVGGRVWGFGLIRPDVPVCR
jgi:hypothetical protein